MPAWLLKLILEFALKYLMGKIGHTATVQHVAALLEKYTPPVDSNPPLSALNNPNESNPPDRGGIPR